MAEKADVTTKPGVSNEERIEELRTEMEHTRSDMHKTVGALQDKLSPSRVKSEIKDKMRDATVSTAKRATDKARDMGLNLLAVIGNNPIPVFLGGIGLGWLIIRSLRHSNGSGEIPPEYLGRETYREGNYTEEGYSEEGPGMGKQLYEKEAELRGQQVEKARRFTDRARSRISETTGSAAERARELSARMRKRASDYSDRASGTARRAKGYFFDSLESNPFGVALAFFALGIAAGLAVPSSKKERDLGRQVASRTSEAAGSTIEKVRSVAEEAKESSKRKAEEEGLL